MCRVIITAVLLLGYSLNLLNIYSNAENISNKTLSNYVNVSQYFDAYSKDLSNIENFLFGRTYKNDNIILRIARIENRLYGRKNTALSIADRMNSIINDYQSDNYMADNQTYCSPQKGLLKRIKDTFIGVPVGYTPQIEPSPYINTYGPSYMQGFYGSNGWRDHNMYNPSYAASKIHILD